MPQVDQVTFFSQIIWLLLCFICIYFIFSSRLTISFNANLKAREFYVLFEQNSWNQLYSGFIVSWGILGNLLYQVNKRFYSTCVQLCLFSQIISEVSRYNRYYYFQVFWINWVQPNLFYEAKLKIK